MMGRYSNNRVTNKTKSFKASSKTVNQSKKVLRKEKHKAI